jgi:hypothetical protein
MKRALSILLSFISPKVVPATLPAYIGAIPDPGQLNTALAQLAGNGMPSSGAVNYASVSGTTLTLTALAAAVTLLTAGSAVTVTIDSAYNIVASLPQPVAVGQKFTFDIVTAASTTVATPTLSDTAVTLAGTTAVLAAAKRSYQGQITQLFSTSGMSLTAGSTFTSLTQVGTTNNYTVALGTNAISPTVGQLIYLAVTSGTLPSGWYPINKVTSATSFVIAAPVAGTAWTATAATLGASGATAPATYSPLVTITGMYSTVTAIMSA